MMRSPHSTWLHFPRYRIASSDVIKNCCARFDPVPLGPLSSMSLHNFLDPFHSLPEHFSFSLGTQSRYLCERSWTPLRFFRLSRFFFNPPSFSLIETRSALTHQLLDVGRSRFLLSGFTVVLFLWQSIAPLRGASAGPGLFAFWPTI